MVKKISDINADLKKLKDNKEKLEYLEKIICHPGNNLSAEANTYGGRLLAEIYAKNKDFGRAGEVLGKIEDFNKSGEMYLKDKWYEKAGEMFEQGKNFSKAALCYSQAGKKIEKTDEQQSRSFYFKSAELYTKAGEDKKAKAIYGKIGLIFEKLGRLSEAGDMYEKGNTHEKAGNMYEKAGNPVLAVRAYAEGGDLSKAEKIYENLHTELKDKNNLSEQLGKLRRLILREKQRNTHSHNNKRIANFAAIIAGGGLMSSMVFLSSNITGNVIIDLDKSSSNIIGTSLFVLGLAATFIYLRKK